MTETSTEPPFASSMGVPTLEDFQHWTQIIGRAQQLLMEFALSPEGQEITQAMATSMTQAAMAQMQPSASGMVPPAFAEAMTLSPAALFDPKTNPFMRAAGNFWQDSLALWQAMASGGAPAQDGPAPERDKRFADPAWQTHPLFAFIRQSYAVIAQRMLESVDGLDGLDEKTQAQVRFFASNLVDALSPSNFALTNPQVLERTLATRGENLVRGLENMLTDLKRGQLSHVDTSRFDVGVNIATTPGKVVHETDIYQLIQYSPTTDKVYETPVVIFPPWINRFYILDLNPQKSFVRWAVEQGLTVFMVSWKSADASMADIIWDDYIGAQIDAIATVCNALEVEKAHCIGYCVAGTTLAATLAVMEAQGVGDRVASATFFTAQVDFSEAGDLTLMVDDAQIKLIEAFSTSGYLDGRYMAATFNALRGRDLIWSYVVNNYLLGEDYAPFDLLYWNGDTTNLPAKWHKAYLTDLYKDNRLVVPGALSAGGVPIDLTCVTTPAYIQAGREDHIAPPASVWKITQHLAGPNRFVLAGSGHIAGVVNPPDAHKYQYWTNDAPCSTLDAFIAGATETKGSWWPDWLAWITTQTPQQVPAKKGRKPGKGSLPAIEDAPGRYVKMR